MLNKDELIKRAESDLARDYTNEHIGRINKLKHGKHFMLVSILALTYAYIDKASHEDALQLAEGLKEVICGRVDHD